MGYDNCVIISTFWSLCHSNLFVCSCDTGSLVDSTGLYSYVFLACSITVALSALFLMLSFYWLDRRDTALKEALSPHVSTVTPESHAAVVWEKVKEPAIETERITTVWTESINNQHHCSMKETYAHNLNTDSFNFRTYCTRGISPMI